jgi:hypothetical protein
VYSALRLADIVIRDNMPRSSKKIQNQNTAVPRRSVPHVKTWKIRYLWPLFVASVTIVSAFQLKDWLSPQVEFSMGGTLDPENALTARFIVTNRSPFALSNVQSYCNIHELTLKETFRLLGLRLMGARVPFLAKGDQSSVICPLNVPDGNGAQSADVTIQVTFDYLGSLLHGTRYQRFTTRTDKQGINVWVPTPSPKGYQAPGPVICDVDVADGCTGFP